MAAAADDSIHSALVPVKRPRPKPTPAPAPEVFTLPEEFSAGRVIEVSIERQTLVAWLDGAVVMSFTISTGMDGWETPVGTFSVYDKTENGYSRPWDVVMPWMLAFHGDYTIHQLTHPPGQPWALQGGSSLGTRASHGCVRVDVGDAERLYHWAPIGTTVWVH
jgi:lipoprotein-anchoring transpeptidase ErfK/SrfK